ncbi:hypothetical protein SAMN06264346_11211 [Chryseobacterium profundimaris]|uniref:Uncharacterized protein n=1 Tax=Chryseobacterium profundimaris TaxID=1387275 RepID=A0ABY1P9X3_9FLAO|nr:hypothetical protein SAMN06264346_11211 [Chryseobacterium profundimaris]
MRKIGNETGLNLSQNLIIRLILFNSVFFKHFTVVINNKYA